MPKIYRALGLMSGTSLDGIDVALIETDGRSNVAPLGFLCCPYTDAFRDRLRVCLGLREGAGDPAVREVEAELTCLHADAVADFLKQEKASADDIDLIGFHGQTIWHNPAARETVQIGDGAALAQMTGIDVVNDFRTADVQAGGQGAPLVPLYHRALAESLTKPVAIINIGGVSNITWIGGERDDEIVAFDLGPGNALLDDWMLRHTGEPCDRDGACAAQGAMDEAHFARFLEHPFFSQQPPKSLDRDAFASFVPAGLNAEDGAATLTMMTVAAIAKGLEACPLWPREVYIAGGGRRNATMMRWLGDRLSRFQPHPSSPRKRGSSLFNANEGGESVMSACGNIKIKENGIPVFPAFAGTGMTRNVIVQSVDDLGWDGDAVEAEAFAYLAVRSFLGLPLSLPNTTRVPKPMTGGRYWRCSGEV